MSVAEKRLSKELSLLLSGKSQNKGSIVFNNYQELLDNKILMVRLIRIGLPYSVFELIMGMSPFSLSAWSSLIGTSFKSMQRYKANKSRLKPAHTEKVLEIAEVIHIGEDVFRSREKFNEWLETPNYALGSQKPYELLKDSFGKDLVMDELVRIDEGIFV